MSLQAKDLYVGYSGHAVLGNINASLEQGEMTVLIGANGSGKSTLLRTLAGAQSPLSGEVLIDNTPVKNLSASKLARKLAIVLTDRTGGGGLRVNELVAIGRHPFTGFFGKIGNSDREAIREALNDVGLSAKSRCFVTELSDGERQKAMIARAIAQSTPIILLDEPTSFLDVSSRFEIMELLSNLAHNYNKAILLSTHDTAAALTVADRVWAVAGNTLHIGGIDDFAGNGILDNVFEGIKFDFKLRDFKR